MTETNKQISQPTPDAAREADILVEAWSDAGLIECLDALKDRIATALTTARQQGQVEGLEEAEILTIRAMGTHNSMVQLIENLRTLAIQR